jgi:molecular chaperone DnaK
LRSASPPLRGPGIHLHLREALHCPPTPPKSRRLLTRSVSPPQGRSFAEAAEDTARVDFSVVPGPDGEALLHCRALSRALTPQSVSSELLRSLLRRAGTFLGSPVSRAVVTVPAYFGDEQRAATLQAAQQAGLASCKLLREPVAAALAFGSQGRGDSTVAVFDLGGGTFDVAFLDVGGGVIEVLATGGDSHLGGDDADALLAQWISSRIAGKGRRLAPGALQAAARRVREALSSRLSLSFSLGADLPTLEIDRRALDSTLAPFLARLSRPLELAALTAGVDLFSARLNAAPPPTLRSKGGGKRGTRRAALGAGASAHGGIRVLDRVLLVGGATRSPSVRELVRTLTASPVADGDSDGVDPDLAVALGAALQAGSLEGNVGGQEAVEAWQAALSRAVAERVARDRGEVQASGAEEEEEEEWEEEDTVTFEDEAAMRAAIGEDALARLRPVELSGEA